MSEKDGGLGVENWKDLCECAWGIIANASGSDWSKESKEWQRAAERWRDDYHRLLKASQEAPGGSGNDNGPEKLDEDDVVSGEASEEFAGGDAGSMGIISDADTGL